MWTLLYTNLFYKINFLILTLILPSECAKFYQLAISQPSHPTQLKNLTLLIASIYLILELNLNSQLRRRNYQKRKKRHQQRPERVCYDTLPGLPNTKCEDVEGQRVQNIRPPTSWQVCACFLFSKPQPQIGCRGVSLLYKSFWVGTV